MQTIVRSSLVLSATHSRAMKLRKAFGLTLKKIRESRNMTQEALAFAADVDRTYISLLERGLRQPTLETLLALAKPLKLKASDLVLETEMLIEKRER